MSLVTRTIPRACYPRYDYIAKYVTRLHRKCNSIIVSCHLNPPCKTPVFDNVKLHIQTRESIPILSDDEVVYRPIPEGKPIDWEDCNFGRTYDKPAPGENSIHPIVCVYSSYNVKEKELFEKSDIVVRISDQKTNQKSVFSMGSSIKYKCVSNRSEFAKTVCFLLERFTLEKLCHTFEIVQILSVETTDRNLRMLQSFGESDILKNPAVIRYMSALINQFSDKQSKVHLAEKRCLTSETLLSINEQLEAFSHLLRKSKEGINMHYDI